MEQNSIQKCKTLRRGRIGPNVSVCSTCSALPLHAPKDRDVCAQVVQSGSLVCDRGQRTLLTSSLYLLVLLEWRQQTNSGCAFYCFRNRRWPDILPHYFMVLVPFFIVLVTYLYIIWSPSSVAIKNVIPLTPVLLFLLVLSTHSRSSALVTVTSLCAMTSAWVKTSHRKTIKYQLILLCALLYLLLPWWGMWPHIQIPAHAVTTAAERSWKRLLSVGRFLLPLHTVNPGIAAAWKLPQTGYTRETGNHTLESYPLH